MKRELNVACFKFYLACHQKLEKKEEQGFIGWDDSKNKTMLEVGLEEHIKKPWTSDNLIDIAIYCNFLWNLDENEKELVLKRFRKK